MSAALGLYRLQQIDSETDQVQTRLKTIRQTLENDLELRAAMDTVSSAEATHQQANKTLKFSESEFEKQRIKIEQVETSLYGGSVKNPKELQDLQLEIVSLKKHLTLLEERELEAMMHAEETANSLQSANLQLENMQSNVSKQNRELTIEHDALLKTMDKLELERKATINDIAEQSLTLYEQLRRQKRGVAVASLSENACSACGTTLTPSQQQTARSVAQLTNCPTCGRILYAG